MALRGEAGWQATHQKAFGKERWPGLYAALRSPVTHVALVNPFLPEAAQAAVCMERQLRAHDSIPLVCTSNDSDAIAEVALDNGDGLLVLASGVKARSETAAVPGPSADQGKANVADNAAATVPQVGPLEEELLQCYFLDGASVIAALALGAQPGHRVLDLCSAPGGKALVLATILYGTQQAVGARTEAAGGRLLCNESSRPRAARLHCVLSSFLPSDFTVAGGRVQVSMADATHASPAVPIQRLGPYDCILVDAPCSSDRHLARQGKTALAHWASGMVKANAERQLELLRCASALVCRGGTILYCTCALSEQENDGVIAKFLKKSGKDFSIEPLLGAPAEGEANHTLTSLVPPGADSTTYGVLILPDRTPFGPMYISKLRRV